MTERVAIIGIGATQFRSISPDVSYKELMFEAATKACEDAGVNPRRDVDTFITCSEDYNEGTSITDEYVPDQLGAAMKPVQTITGEGLHGIAAAFMMLRTGSFGIAMVEAFSKASNVLTPDGILACAQDPVYVRPLEVNSLFIAGLEMNLFLHESGVTPADCARVAIRNRAAALKNPLAAWPARLDLEDFAHAEPVAFPLTALDIARPADGAVVVILATESRARSIGRKPVWVEGIGWCNGSPNLETRDWATPHYVTTAADMAYRMAGVTDPGNAFDFCEIDDTYTYKELQHAAALGLGCRCSGRPVINPSGGALGMGHLHEATGLARLYWAVKQLRREAGDLQLDKADRCLVQAWRGVPTESTVCTVLAA
uniref:Thiolase C-terminal domain-containing protein n=1 Tax=candidate division WOR-3 bacterium TaxID=2052148 RepID=A0A7C4CCC8_UNCW3